ncbi:uncharacterized protein LOC134818882 isoform X2 [Bolinopsis microptera]|uniref:uncharacterized protein LOC134818882 isoform X2 n=1 Tax=Bolinopsis microptera TaxID=2820187 RepID=UPI00307B0E27
MPTGQCCEMEAVLLRLENNQVQKVVGNVKLTLECKPKQNLQSCGEDTILPARPAISRSRSATSVHLLVHEAESETHTFNLRSCYLYPDKRDPRLIHVHRGADVRHYGDHTDALQFATLKLANDFLRELCACRGQCGPTVNIESLHDQTGPKTGVWNATATKRELLSVDRAAGNHIQTSSIHSDLSSGSGPAAAAAAGPKPSGTLAENTKSAVIVKTGDSSTPVSGNIQQQGKPDEEEYSSEIKEEKFQRCKYCNKQFDFGEEVSPDELCPSAPNKMRETLDRACCVVCYKGAWYHLTKDTLDDEGQDIGRCRPGAGMTTTYWCLLGFLSVVCAPCLVFWCPLNVCELAAQHAGLTGGPHSLTTIKKKTTMVPSKRKEGQEDGGYGSEGDRVITEQPRVSSQLEPLTVRISLPQEEEEEDYDEEEAEQAHMMGFEVDEGQHVRTARGRVTPQVQRAQSELVPDRRAASPNVNVVQRSMSESRG